MSNNENELFRLLDIDHRNKKERRKLDCDAIIKAVRSDPHSIDIMYSFSHGNHDESSCYPLHKAIMLYAPIHVIDALSSDRALAAKSSRANAALALTFQYKSSWAVVKLLLEKRPDIAREKNIYDETPLIIACKNNLHFEVVSLLLSAWPGAIKEINNGMLPIHHACGHKVPPEIVSLLLSAWPDSVREKCINRWTPLHLACYYAAPIEVIFLLISTWPGAIRQKTSEGHTPFHMACCGSTLDVVSLLFNAWPAAVRGKSVLGRTPLHSAVSSLTGSRDIIVLLLEKWPDAMKERDKTGRLPIQESNFLFAPENVQELLNKMHYLYFGGPHGPSPKQIMTYFANTEWWSGVSLVFDRYPSVSQSLGLQTNIMADFLSMVGRCCKLKTLWEVILDEQDLLAGTLC